MINDLFRTFNVLDGFYASIQEACDLHKITRDSVIPENLEGLFEYLSNETSEEVKVAISSAFKIKSRQLSEAETDRVRKGFETVKNLLENYDWLFAKDNIIKINVISIDSIICVSGLFEQ